MWIEKMPEVGDTVKIKFAEFTKKGTRIGILDRYFGDYAIVDMGACCVYLDRFTTFFVYTKF
jgi:hypothetical protein